MACSSRRTDGWIRVPDGSTLHVSVVPPDSDSEKKFTAAGRWLPRVGSVENWTDGQLSSGPKKKKLAKSAEAYGALIEVSFPASALTKALIKAKIVKPDGKPLKKQYCYTAKGKDGSSDSAHLAIAMLQKSPS